jgi:hypothetical protein
MVGLDHCGQYKYRRITTLIFDVESEVRNNYGDEYEVKRDDERKDNDANIHEEAPNNPNILIWHLHGSDSITFHRSNRLCLISNGILKEDK